MGAGLVISLVMLRSRSHVFGKVTAYMGVLASVLLLVGDFSIGMAHSNIIATLIGIGYVLLMTWFFLIARRLFQLGSRAISRKRRIETEVTSVRRDFAAASSLRNFHVLAPEIR